MKEKRFIKKEEKNPQSTSFLAKQSKIKKPITKARNNIDGGIIHLL
jgi:hypothetical protein